MCKNTNIPSEIHSIFSKKRRSSVMYSFSSLLETLHVNNGYLGGKKRENCQLTNHQLFQIIVLLPFFAIKGFSHYPDSALHRMFGGKKDILYSFMSQDNINWSNLIYNIVIHLITKVITRKDYKKSHLPTVIIADDTDLPKTGIHMESIGKIFSHVHQKCILGYKALMLCWSDGRTQFMLDASLHGEKGKNLCMEQGLTAKQRESRYNRTRDEKSHIYKRQNEYFTGKGKKLIEMLRHAIKTKIPFDYLLVDSWFTCYELVDFVCKSHKKFNLLGMAKMGNTKYTTKWGEITGKAIIIKLSGSKSIKYSRRYRCHYASADVMIGERNIRLFFCRRGEKEGWKKLLTTNVKLEFPKAYEIYSMRWAIEVFFADGKRLLNLSGCSSRDFSSQIAHISLVMIRYNLLASVKRSLDYETIEGLFNDVFAGVHELTVVEKIWAIILEVVNVIAQLTGADEDELMIQIIENNKRLEALKTYALAA